MTPDEFASYVKAEFRKRLAGYIDVRAGSFVGSGNFFQFSIMLFCDGKPRWGATRWVELCLPQEHAEEFAQRMLIEAFSDAVAAIPPAPEREAA